jgi:hypothetical protein
MYLFYQGKFHINAKYISILWQGHFKRLILYQYRFSTVKSLHVYETNKNIDTRNKDKNDPMFFCRFFAIVRIGSTPIPGPLEEAKPQPALLKIRKS